MIVIELVLLLLAVILLLLASSDRIGSRWNLGWLGVACFVLAYTLPKLWPVL